MKVDRDLVVDMRLAAVATLLLVGVGYTSFSGVLGDRSTSASAGSSRAVGTLTHRTNDVRRRSAGELVWRDVLVEAPIFEGDSVYVAPSSEAAIRLTDGARFELEGSSLVVLGAAASGGAVPTSAIELKRGSVTGAAGDRPLAVKVGQTTARLDELASARVQLQQGDVARVTVSTGKAELVREGGALALSVGERGTLGAGAVGTIERLAISLETPARAARLLAGHLRFAWTLPRRLGPASLEISTDPELRSPEIVYESRGTALELSTLAPGVYFWRVRAQVGGETLQSEERKLVVVADVSPIVVEPRPDEIVDLANGGGLRVVWTALDEAAMYDVELEQPSTKARTHTTTRAALRASIDELGVHEGACCVRVRARTAEQLTMAWSPRQCFRVSQAPVLRAPALYEPKAAPTRPATPSAPASPPAGRTPRGTWLWRLIGGVAYAATAQPAIVLRWERVGGAQGYIVEIAADAAFRRVLLRETASEPYLKWQPPDRVVYYWRVRGVDGEGREGQVSETRLLELLAAAASVPPPVTSAAIVTTPAAAAAAQSAAASPSASPVARPGKRAGAGASDGGAGARPAGLSAVPASGAGDETTSTSAEPAQPNVRRGHGRALDAGRLLAARIGLFYDGAALALRPGAELSWRLWDAWPLSAAVRVSYYTRGASQAAFAGQAGVTERLHALPCEALARYALPLGYGQLELGAGLSLGPSLTRVASANVTTWRTRLELGALAALGVSQEAGAGLATGEVTLVAARTHAGVVESSPRGAGLSVGYQIPW